MNYDHRFGKKLFKVSARAVGNRLLSAEKKSLTYSENKGEYWRILR